jgi:hypothetical protein
MSAHLELMSKPRLIAIIHGAEARAEQNAELARYWRRILRGLPPDPHAQEHRETLAAELNFGGRARRRAA